MELLLSVTIFLTFGAVFVLANLVLGYFARPRIPNPEKATVYECGEPVIGSSWVQFDLRFYIVALVYLINKLSSARVQQTSLSRQAAELKVTMQRLETSLRNAAAS